jgi:hypothetical protein
LAGETTSAEADRWVGAKGVIQRRSTVLSQAMDELSDRLECRRKETSIRLRDVILLYASATKQLKEAFPRAAGQIEEIPEPSTSSDVLH